MGYIRRDFSYVAVSLRLGMFHNAKKVTEEEDYFNNNALSFKRL